MCNKLIVNHLIYKFIKCSSDNENQCGNLSVDVSMRMKYRENEIWYYEFIVIFLVKYSASRIFCIVGVLLRNMICIFTRYINLTKLPSNKTVWPNG